MDFGSLTLLKFKWYPGVFCTEDLKVTDFQSFWYFQGYDIFIWSFIRSMNPHITGRVCDMEPLLMVTAICGKVAP